MTGACHAPVDGRQSKALADADPTAAPVPISKSADFEMNGRGDFQNLLCLWAVALKQIRLRKGCRSRRILRMWVLPASRKKTAEASAEAAYPLGERNALLMAPLSKVLLRYFWQK